MAWCSNWQVNGRMQWRELRVPLDPLRCEGFDVFAIRRQMCYTSAGDIGSMSERRNFHTQLPSKRCKLSTCWKSFHGKGVALHVSRRWGRWGEQELSIEIYHFEARHALGTTRWHYPIFCLEKQHNILYLRSWRSYKPLQSDIPWPKRFQCTGQWKGIDAKMLDSRSSKKAMV